MTNSTLHREVVTKHTTFQAISQYGRVSIRKTAGAYVVRHEDFEDHKVTTQTFKTLRGASIALEAWKEMM